MQITYVHPDRGACGGDLRAVGWWLLCVCVCRVSGGVWLGRVAGVCQGSAKGAGGERRVLFMIALLLYLLVLLQQVFQSSHGSSISCYPVCILVVSRCLHHCTVQARDRVDLC